jgi:hypothetical protein
VASAGIPRDGDLRPAWGLFTWTGRGWHVQLRRVRYTVRRTTETMLQRRVPGAPLLIHKMLEGRYRHHHALSQAARRHAGIPPSHPHNKQSATARRSEAAQEALESEVEGNLESAEREESLPEQRLLAASDVEA